MDLIIGVILGWVSMYIAFIVVKAIRQKKGIKDKYYRNLPFTTKLRDSVRHIVFEYNIKRKNNDFLFNIDLKGEVVMQIMHRAHFPELCSSESDVGFGLALYIPVKDWPKSMIMKLDKIVEEETQVFKINKFGNLEYYVIDLNQRVRFGGYFLVRIIKEVFEADESQFSSTLYSEGNLPYHLN